MKIINKKTAKIVDSGLDGLNAHMLIDEYQNPDYVIVGEKYTFAIESDENLIRFVRAETIQAESVADAWSQINEIVQHDEEATLVYINEYHIGEPLRNFQKQ
jgi:hypothetical protein